MKRRKRFVLLTDWKREREGERERERENGISYSYILHALKVRLDQTLDSFVFPHNLLFLFFHRYWVQSLLLFKFPPSFFHNYLYIANKYLFNLPETLNLIGSFNIHYIECCNLLWHQNAFWLVATAILVCIKQNPLFLSNHSWNTYSNVNHNSKQEAQGPYCSSESYWLLLCI
jgi:hypothetical protein